MAGLVYNDVVRRLKLFAHTESRANVTMKSIVIIVGIYCVLVGMIVEKFQSIFHIVNIVAGVSQGTIFGIFTLGMLFPRANYKAALWSFLLALGFLTWIAVGHQFYISTGRLQYNPLPTSIDGCAALNITAVINELVL